jgi:DNA processing protein
MEPILVKIEDLPTAIQEVLDKNCEGIWCLGNCDLLKSRALSFCGSRKASEKGLDTAYKCAKQAVEHDLVCISGNAAGIDRNIHLAALDAGGASIFVLPEGIDDFRPRRELRPLWNWEKCLVISQFERNAKWQVWRAMKRNELIIALGMAMIVIEAGETGGTHKAAQQALKMGKPLFAIDYDIPVSGNQAITQSGAETLRLNKKTKLPNIQKILDLCSNSQIKNQGQMSLPLI